MNIGWIGTGDMGIRMAERLVCAGHTLYVYNRTRSKAQRILKTGNAVLLESPAAVAEACDMVFTSITNDRAMRDILYGELGLLGCTCSGKILVDMSTLGPAYSAQLQNMLHDHGMLYLSAPVVGSMLMIEQGMLKILVSGDSDAYRTAEPYLRNISRTIVLLGDGNQARYMKIAVNMMICSYLTIYGEVLLAGEGMGFGWKELNGLLEACGGASPMLKDKGTTLKERVWAGGTALTSTAMKDLGLALEIAYEGCFSLPLTAIACQYDRYMYASGKFGTYSTFGTIGVLEDWCDRCPEENTRIPDERKSEAAEALTTVLTGVSIMLAAEALRFCRNTNIDRQTAMDCLSTCHGASTFFKQLYTDGGGDISILSVRNALRIVLQSSKEAGLFVPILATANEQMNQVAAALTGGGLQSLLSEL